MEVDVDQLREAVEHMHGAPARFREAVPVTERFMDQLVWEGTVNVFELEGHPTARLCYAWSLPVDGSDRRRFYAVLGAPPVGSAAEAIRAAIIHEHKTDRSR